MTTLLSVLKIYHEIVLSLLYIALKCSMGVSMKQALMLLIATAGIYAQNAAVSSYLNPNYAENGDVRIREVRIPSTGLTIGTYWCTLGYWTTGKTTGYGGMQWTSDSKAGPRNYIYSQWNDNSTSAFNVPTTKVSLFGGEGTGVKSINNDPENQWKPDFWHVTADRLWNEGNNTYFAYITRNGETGIWHHVMTWSTPESNLKFKGGGYCFLEDWSGDGKYRESNIRKGWERNSSTKVWTPITEYHYTINAADTAVGKRSANKKYNWAGGIKEDESGKYFYMGAGGTIASTNNSETDYTIDRTEKMPQEEYGTAKISVLTATPIAGGKLQVKWINDNRTVPQWAYKISVKDGATTVITKSDTIPQRRIDTLQIGSLTPTTKSYSVTLDLVDFFDGTTTKTISFGSGTDQSYLHLLTPTAASSVKTETPLMISWDSNSPDSVSMKLIRGTNEIKMIGKEAAAKGKFSWSVPAGIDAGKNYRIVLTGTKLSALVDTSAQFAITTPDSSHLIVPHKRLRVVSFDSQQDAIGHAGVNVLDSNPETIWHTSWSPSKSLPHEIVIKMDSTFSVSGLKYLPRQDGTNGRIGSYEIYTSLDGSAWGRAITSGQFEDVGEEQLVMFDSIPAQYVKLKALTEVNGQMFTSVAELNLLYAVKKSVVGLISIPESTKKSLEVTILPGKISVDCGSSNGSTLNLYGINGELLFSTNLKSGMSTVPVGSLGLSHGIYILNIESTIGSFARQIMLK